MNDLRHRYVKANGRRLHLVEAGPADGKPVVLLHGFPEFWFGWRHQIPYLAKAGLRVLAPDGRGYHRSDRPVGVSNYRRSELRADVIGLLDELGIGKATVIGHDWGAAVAWSVALYHPQRVDRLGILNVPHPAVLTEVLRRYPRQWLRSWYILYFQLPWLPEFTLGLFDGWLLAASMKRTSRAGTFSFEELKRYQAAWAKGALRTMIHWYRAALRYSEPKPPSWELSMPVRILWGQEDSFLIPENAELSLKFCPHGELIRLPGVSHWLQHEAADAVNRYLLEWCT
jgi:pimeloyl-ACP methyl ester carboxylesterase